MRKVAALAVIILGALAVMGSGGGSYQGGSYGSRGASYLAGGAASGKWKGHELVMVVLADDGYDANLVWSRAADSLGVSYTLAPSDAPTGGVDAAGFLTTEQLATVAGRGIDVGSTGTHHRTNGIKAHVYTAGQDAAYNDSLNVSTTPAWVTSATGVAPRSWSADGYQWTYRAAKNARANGYKAVAAGFGYDAAASGLTADHEYIRSVIEGGTVGWDRMDVAHFLPWDDVGCLYAIGCFPGETSIGAIFGASAAGSTDKATLFSNLDAAADTVRAHGNAPIVFRLHGSTVTREDFENVVEWSRSRRVWMTSLKEMANYYRARHVPRDPPHWAYQAKLDGITAADSIFWGPPAPAAATCATDSFVFSFDTTAVTRASYTGQVNEGHGFGWLDYDTQGNSGSWSAKVFRPQAGGFASGHPSVTYGFNISSLAGKTVVSADLYYYTEFALSESSLPAAEQNYTVVIGVTNPAVLQYMNNVETSYDYGDSAQTIARTVELVTYDRYYKLGSYVYPNEGYTKFLAGWGRQRVTDYVQRVVDDSLPSAGFMLWGKKVSSNAYCNVDMPKATASKRPYLVVRTCK